VRARFAALGLALGLALASVGRGHAAEGVVKDWYLVVLDDAADPAAVASELGVRHGLALGHVYRHALRGFAAKIPPHRLAAIRNDPRVAFVQPDRVVRLAAQTLPTGIDRVDADRSPTARIDGLDERVDVDVAVLDTGIARDHPELNVVGGKACVGGSSDDQHGHGTHVAGTIGALDNRSGVVGVAPGARLWAVRVLDRRGLGTTASVVCGLDFVTANARTIRVANLSLSGPGSDDGDCGDRSGDALHRAVCRAAAAGVTIVVAAGNDGADAKDSVPAAYDEVITVSALADSDGQPGGLGASTSYGADDTFATFSNYGADVDLAAPGVNVLSTYRGKRYATLSGTSMASPHVAGAAALYLARNPGATPAEVRAALIAAGETLGNGHSDPSGRHPEPVVRASGF
jgi:subtilisin family serine protease